MNKEERGYLWLIIRLKLQHNNLGKLLLPMTNIKDIFLKEKLLNLFLILDLAFLKYTALLQPIGGLLLLKNFQKIFLKWIMQTLSSLNITPMLIGFIHYTQAFCL